MNDPELNNLFARARARRTDTSRHEYAFETRLMARLCAERQTQGDTSSVWAMVSWRMVPFFAICVLALTIWQSNLINLTDEAAAFNSVDNPESVELWDNLN